MEDIDKALARHGLRLRKTTAAEIQIGEILVDRRNSRHMLVARIEQRTTIIDDQSAAPTKSHLFTFAGENFAGHQITMGPFDPNEDFCALDAIPLAASEQRTPFRIRTIHDVDRSMILHEIEDVERMLVEEGCRTEVSVGGIKWGRDPKNEWRILTPMGFVEDYAWAIPELIKRARAARPQPIGDIIRAIRIACGVPV